MYNFQEIYKGNIDWLEKNTIFVTLHGSRLYGTHTDQSDVDMKGICIPPKEYFFGFNKNFEQAIQSEPIDLVIYSINKFMKLAADCNPNIIELLFAPKDKWILSTPIFEKLHKNRHLFLSLKAKHTFSGYATAQLKRMKSHRNFLLSPPTHKPTREEYGLSNANKVSRSIMGAFDNLNEKHEILIDDSIMKILTAEKRYTQALTQYNQYQNWLKTRNKKRAENEKKLGYDGKNALHLVRLMKMCEEILTTGEVNVERPDAKELLEIRNGAWNYEQLIDWADELDSHLNNLYENNKTLPHTPDKNKLDQLCIELVEEHLKGKYQ